MRRKVALKVFDAGLVPSSEHVSRFEREAWIGGRLNHPNIVKVFSQGQVGTSHYIAMELVEGRSLHAEIQRLKTEHRSRTQPSSRLETEEIRRTVSLFVGVADALAHVHEQGIVHRDIKPLNMLLPSAGSRLLLSDFGLARDESASRMTRRGDFMGTIRYMSPEQLLANRATVDARSDIYSFGVSLYEAVALDLPFSADSEQAYISAVSLKEPIPAGRRRRAIPRDLETVLMKCLERDPERRYASAHNLRDDLTRFLQGLPVHARRLGLTRRLVARIWRSRVAIASGIGVLVFTVGLGRYYLPPPDIAATKRTSYERGLAWLETVPVPFVAESISESRDLVRDLQNRKLPPDLARRTTRALLRPLIESPSLVSRDRTSSVRATIRPPADLLVVAQADVLIDGGLAFSDSPRLVWRHQSVPALTREQARHLGVGEHRVSARWKVWLLDWKEWDDMRKSRRAVYDDDWLDDWNALRRKGVCIEVDDVLTDSRVFQLVEQLPRDFPTQVDSPVVGQLLQEIRFESRVVFEKGGQLQFCARWYKRLPITIAGILTLTGEDGREFAHLSAVFGENDTQFCDELAPLDERTELLKSRLERGEKLLWRGTVVPDRDTAIDTAGVDRYWGKPLYLFGQMTCPPSLVR